MRCARKRRRGEGRVTERKIGEEYSVQCHHVNTYYVIRTTQDMKMMRGGERGERGGKREKYD